MGPGRVTAAVVEERLEAAGRVLLALPHAGCFPAGFRTLWPAADGVSPERCWLPSAAEITAMDEAYRWTSQIADVDERRLVLMRSLVWRESGRHVWTWNRLRRLTGRHHETLQATWGRGIDRIVRRLNSLIAGSGGPRSGFVAGAHFCASPDGRSTVSTGPFTMNRA
jgi:hypothetical protein